MDLEPGVGVVRAKAGRRMERMRKGDVGVRWMGLLSVVGIRFVGLAWRALGLARCAYSKDAVTDDGAYWNCVH